MKLVHPMRTCSGLLLLFAASWAFFLELEALVKPAATPYEDPADRFTIPLTWYVHLGWFAVTTAVAWTAIRLLNRGILGRLVRGRGFQPAPR